MGWRNGPKFELSAGHARVASPTSVLMYVPFTLTQDGREIHRFPLFIPPLEHTFSQEQCVRRAQSYIWHGYETLQQMYMSTTRGLNP